MPTIGKLKQFVFINTTISGIDFKIKTITVDDKRVKL